MDLNVTKIGFRHLSEFLSQQEIYYTATMGHAFPRPLPARPCSDTSKVMAKPPELWPPVIVADPPARGRIWTMHSWTHYIQSRPPLRDAMDWGLPLTFVACGDAYACASGSWTQEQRHEREEQCKDKEERRSVKEENRPPRF